MKTTPDNHQSQEAGSTRILLRNANFRLLWAGQIVSDFGDALTNLTLVILINRLTGSTSAIALLLIVITLPQLTVGLLAGVYVDRLDRKRLMIISDLLRGLLVLSFIAIAAAEILWPLYVIAFVQAGIGAFFTPARSALLPNIIERENLLSANSLAQLSNMISRILGAGAAGVLAGTIKVFWPAFLLDASTFFISLVLISRVTVPIQVERSTETVEAEDYNPAVFGELLEGLQLIARSRLLSGTLSAMGVTMLGLGAINVLFVPFLVNDLQLPETFLGVIDLSQTVSMILSAALVAVFAARFRPTRIISATLILLGIAIALISQTTHIWQVAAILFAVGWILAPLQAAISTITQTAVDDALRGRIAAALNAVISSASLVSMALAGLLGALFGVRNVFILGGAMTIFAGLISIILFAGITPSSIYREQLAPAPAISASSIQE